MALSETEDNTSGSLNRGGIADLRLLRTLLAIRQKSREPGFWEVMDSFVLVAYTSLGAGVCAGPLRISLSQSLLYQEQFSAIPTLTKVILTLTKAIPTHTKVIFTLTKAIPTHTNVYAGPLLIFLSETFVLRAILNHTYPSTYSSEILGMVEIQFHAACHSNASRKSHHCVKCRNFT